MPSRVWASLLLDASTSTSTNARSSPGRHHPDERHDEARWPRCVMDCFLDRARSIHSMLLLTLRLPNLLCAVPPSLLFSLVSDVTLPCLHPPPPLRRAPAGLDSTLASSLLAVTICVRLRYATTRRTTTRSPSWATLPFKTSSPRLASMRTGLRTLDWRPVALPRPSKRLTGATSLRTTMIATKR